jgi:hypothetical protein
VKLPWVSRALYENAVVRAEFAERELRIVREVAEARTAGAELRVADIFAVYRATSDKIADMLAVQIAPRPVVQGSAPADFSEFPPEVAGALAVATAGFRKDDQRAIYDWVRGQLADKMAPAEIAATLKNGLPVTIEPSELH